MSTRLSGVTLLLLLSIYSANSMNAFAQARYPEPLEEGRTRLAIQLVANGVEITETALIDAMLHKPETGMSGLAAMMLGTLPKTPSSVQALRAALSAPAVSDPNAAGWEGIVTSAAWALGQLGESGWEDSAIAQLPKLVGLNTRMNMAKTLANAGRAEGWPIVRDALANADPRVILVALGNVEYFDQLKDPSRGGQTIDVVAELTKVAEVASAAPTGLPIVEPVRTQLEKKIADIKAIKEKKK
jgi:hypothetical protein